jgi:hypothetical protein
MAEPERATWRRMLPATLQFLITMIACAINERMPWCPESHRRGSGGFTVVVIQDAAEP